jgi:hypothetical protein
LAVGHFDLLLQAGALLLDGGLAFLFKDGAEFLESGDFLLELEALFFDGLLAFGFEGRGEVLEFLDAGGGGLACWVMVCLS